MSSVESPPSEESAFSFWVRRKDEAYEIVLDELALGSERFRGSRNRRLGWQGEFRGRPEIARQLSSLLKLSPPGRAAMGGVLGCFRSFFRFLDQLPNGEQINSLSDLTDLHGAQFRAWVSDSQNYGRLRSYVDRLRLLSDLPQLGWPSPKRSSVNQIDDVDLLSVRRFYNACKGEARQIKQMFRDGRELALRGEDPRASTMLYGHDDPWLSLENQAWLIFELTKNCVPSTTEFIEQGAGEFHLSKKPSVRTSGPKYIAPGMTVMRKSRNGIVRKLRWFHPSDHDISVFLWLFMLTSGWNLSTCLSIDISRKRNWLSRHPHKNNYRVIHAYKGRSDKHQILITQVKPEWHPYRLLIYVLTITASLRKTLREELKRERLLLDAAPNDQRTARILELEKAISSPWLYQALDTPGNINRLTARSHLGRINQVGRAIVDRSNLKSKRFHLQDLTTSSARDAWIGYAYTKSGNNVLLAQMAAQHANNRILIHYLKRRSYKRNSERAVREMQNAIIDLVRSRRIVDPTYLRILVQRGELTVEQEQRLLDYRYRTRLGMGCRNPTNPPRHIAPDHPPGALCGVQRCTGCEHGICFEDSIDLLCKAKVELEYIFRSIPISSWKYSSFEQELISINETLKLFDDEIIAINLLKWETLIKQGSEIIHDTYPTY